MIPLHGRDAARTDTSLPLSEGTIEAIAKTYDLVGLWSLAGDQVRKPMNSLLNGGDATGKLDAWQDRWTRSGAMASAAAGNNPAWGNQTGEIVDLDLMFRTPAKGDVVFTAEYYATPGGSTFDGVVIGTDHGNAKVTALTPPRRRQTVERAFLNLSAEIPTVRLLPFGY